MASGPECSHTCHACHVLAPRPIGRSRLSTGHRQQGHDIVSSDKAQLCAWCQRGPVLATASVRPLSTLCNRTLFSFAGCCGAAGLHGRAALSRSRIVGLQHGFKWVAVWVSPAGLVVGPPPLASLPTCANDRLIMFNRFANDRLIMFNRFVLQFPDELCNLFVY